VSHETIMKGEGRDSITATVNMLREIPFLSHMITQHPLLSAAGAVSISIFSFFFSSTAGPSPLSSKGDEFLVTVSEAGAAVGWCIGLMLPTSASFPCERVSTQSGFGLAGFVFFVFSVEGRSEGFASSFGGVTTGGVTLAVGAGAGGAGGAGGGGGSASILDI
jgi:hypothetical protein